MKPVFRRRVRQRYRTAPDAEVKNGIKMQRKAKAAAVAKERRISHALYGEPRGQKAR